MTIDSRNHSPFFPSCFVRDSSQNILGGWQSKKFLSVKVFITWSEENKLRGYVRTAEKTIVFFTEMFSSVPENIRNGDFISLREWIGKKKGELEHASEFKFLACFDPYEPLPNRFIGIQADDIKHGNWVVNATWEVRMSLDRRSKQLFTSIQTPDSLYWFNEEGGERKNRSRD